MWTAQCTFMWGKVEACCVVLPPLGEEASRRLRGLSIHSLWRSCESLLPISTISMWVSVSSCIRGPFKQTSSKMLRGFVCRYPLAEQCPRTGLAVSLLVCAFCLFPEALRHTDLPKDAHLGHVLLLKLALKN